MKLFITWRKKKETTNETQIELKRDSKIKSKFIEFLTKIKSNQKVALASVLTLSLIAFSLCTVSYFVLADNDVFYASDFVNDPDLGYANVTFEYGEYPQTKANDTLTSSIKTNGYVHDDGVTVTYNPNVSRDPNGDRYLRTGSSPNYTYYKYEPIKWRILSIDKTNDEVFAVAENVLGIQQWSTTSETAWTSSVPLESWLNWNFSNVAFSSSSGFSNSALKSKQYETGVSEELTLLSYDDITGTMGVKYGFRSEADSYETNDSTYVRTEKTNRLGILTDYALSQYPSATTRQIGSLWVSPNSGKKSITWWTRTIADTRSPYYGSYAGGVYAYDIFETKNGVRPAATFYLSEIKDSIISIDARPRRTGALDSKRLAGFVYDDGAMTMEAPSGLTVDDADKLDVIFDDGSVYYITYDGNGATSGVSYVQAVNKSNAGTANINVPSSRFSKKVNVELKTNGVGEDKHLESNANILNYNSMPDGSGTTYELSGTVPSNPVDTTLYAQWGGADEITLPDAQTTDESGEFLGWFNLAEGGHLIGGAGDKITPDGDLILYAHFENINPDIFYASDLVNDSSMGYLNVTFEYGEYPQSKVADTSGFPASPVDGQECVISSGSKAGRYRFRSYNGKSGWFKYEPIKWRILSIDKTNDEVFVLSENILDFMAWDVSGSNNFWSDNPPIRRFLNGDFYNKAFLNTEGKPISKNYWNNADTATPCDGTDAIDKVTLLSDLDLGNHEFGVERGTRFGFVSNSNNYENKNLDPVDRVYEIYSENTNRLALLTDYSSLVSDFKGKITIPDSVNNGKVSGYWWTKTRYAPTSNDYLVCTYKGNSEGYDKENVDGVRPAATFKVSDIEDLQLTISNTNVHSSDYAFGGYTFIQDEIIDLSDLYDRVSRCGGITLKNLPYVKAHFGEGTFVDNIRVYSSPSTKIINNDGSIDQEDDPTIYSDFINNMLSSRIPGFDVSEYLRENGDIKLDGNHDIAFGYETVYLSICNQLQVFMFTNDSGVTSGKLTLDDSYYWKDHEWLEDNDGNKLYELHYGLMEFNDNYEITMTYSYQGDLAGTEHTVYKVPGTESEYYIDDISNGTWDESVYRYVVIRPKYKIENYAVNFDANTGRGKMKSQTIKFEDNDKLNANKFKKGVEVSFKGNGGSLGLFDHTKSAKYKFAGWNTEADGSGTSYENGAKLNLSSEDGIYDITLYAQWDTASDDVELPTPSRSTYDFDGWYTSPDGGEKIGEGGETFTPLSDTVLYAHWFKSGTSNVAKPDIFYASDFSNNPEYGYVNATFEYGTYPQRAITDPSVTSGLDNYHPDENGFISAAGMPIKIFKDSSGNYYYCDSIKWRILSIDDINGEVLAIAENVLDCQPWDDQILNDNKWSDNPTIRQWLNDDFLNKAFTKDEQDTIIQKFYTLGESDLDGVLTSDKVTLLSIDELSGDKGVKFGFARDPLAIEDVDNTDLNAVKVLSEYTNRNATGSDFAINKYASWLTRPILQKDGSINDGKIILNWWTKSRLDADETRAVFGDSKLDKRQSDTLLGVRPVVTFDFDAIKSNSAFIDSCDVHGSEYTNLWNDDYGPTFNNKYYTPSEIDTLIYTNMINVGNVRLFKTNFALNSYYPVYKVYTSPSTSGFHGDGTRYHFDNPEDVLLEKVNDYLHWEEIPEGLAEACPPGSDGFNLLIGTLFYDSAVIHSYQVEGNVVKADLTLKDDYEWEGHPLAKDADGKTIYEVYSLYNDNLTKLGEVAGPNHTIYFCEDMYSHFDDPTSDIKFDHQADTSLLIRPKWNPTECIIHFDANGGSGTMEDEEINVLNGGTLSQNKFTNGYTVLFKTNGGEIASNKKKLTAGPVFAGWNTEPDGSGTDYTDEGFFQPTNDFELTLYAQWGDSTNVTLPLPTKEGATFAGWFAAPVGGTRIGGSGDTYSPTADSLLYAHWTKTGTTKEIKPNIFYAGDLSNNPEYGYVNATFEYGEYPSKSITIEEVGADTYLFNAFNQKFNDGDYEESYSLGGLIFSIPDEENPSKINKYLYTRINDVYVFYKYEPIKWRVLSIDYTNGEVFAVSEYVLDGLEWNDEADSNIFWSDNPKVRRFLNGDFYNNAFTSEEKENIIKKSYPISNDGYEGTFTADFITLLSAEEVETSNAIKYGFIASSYSNENAADTDLGNNTKPIYTEYTNRLAYPTDYGFARYNIYDIKYELQNASSPNNNKKALNYWLRSRFLDGGVRYVYANGTTYYGNNYYNVIGIRPAVTFDFDAIKDEEVTINQIGTRGSNIKVAKDAFGKNEFVWKTVIFKYGSLEDILQDILNMIGFSESPINLNNLYMLQGNFYKGDTEITTYVSMPFSTNYSLDDGTKLGETSPEFLTQTIGLILDMADPSLKGEYSSISEMLRALGLITYEDHDDITAGEASLYSFISKFIKVYLSTNDDLSVTGEVVFDDSYVWDDRVWAEDADGNKLYELHLCTSSLEGEKLKYSYSYKGDIAGVKHTVVKVPDENKFYFADKPEVKWSTDEHTLIIARPKFLPNSNKITLNLEGGEGTESIYTDKEETGFFQDPGCNTPLTELKITIPEKAGYNFEGFFSEENGGGTKYINSDGTFTSNFKPDILSDGDELYAHWSTVTYSITYVLNGATNNASNPSTYTIESSDITIGEPQLSGYSFLKWTGENLDDNTKSFVIPSGSTGNRTYTAVFDVDTYQINYHLSNGEVIDPANPVSYTVLTDTFKLNNPVKEHYEFTGWTGANGDTEEIEVTISKGTTGDLDFYPHFTPVKYKVTFNSNGGSSVSDKEVDYGSSIGTLQTPTRDGYTFKGWFIDDTTFLNEIKETDTMTGNVSAYAKWEIITYQISYNLNGGSLPQGSSNPYSYTVETETFTLVNPSKAGYAFDGWNGTDTSGAEKPITITKGTTGNRTYAATFSIRKFVLSFDSNGGSSISNKELDYNSEFGTLSSPERTGYEFKGWFFDDDTFQNEATSQSQITDDVELHAKWSPKTYQITYSGLEDATVSGNPNSYTIESGQIVLNAPTKVGYDFEGWTGSNGTAKEKNVTISQGSTGDKSYVANWKVKQLTLGFNSNGGSNVTSKTLSYGSVLGDLAIPTKKDALFAGWFKEATYQNRAESTDLITDNMTLYALWYEVSPIDDETYSAVQIKPSLTVTDSKGNTINIPNSDVAVSFGENVNAGEGSVTLTGFGNSVTIKFKINKRTITSSDIQIDPSLKEIVKYKNGTVNQKTNVEVSPFVKLASCNSEEVILNVSESFISDSSGNPVTRPTRKEKTSSYDCIKLSGLSVSNSNYQLEPGLSSKIFENFTELVDNEVPKLEEILVLNTKKMKKGDVLNVSVRFTEELNASSADLATLKQNFKVTYDLGTDFLGEELTLDSISISNSKTIFNFKGTIKSDLEDEKELALSNFNFIKVQGSDLEDVCGNKLDMDQTGIILPSGYYVSTKKEQPAPSGGGGGGGGAGPVYTILPVDDSIKANKSYMNGYEDETFKPSNPVSREEVAAIVARLNGEFDEQINFTSFNDFEDALDRWSKNYIGFCRYKDLFHGYEDGSFHPTANMTRAELAVLVSNFLRVQNTDFTGVDLTKTAFSDVDGRWYEESVNKLAYLGILNGYEDGTFKGDNPVTRIEVAIVMNKINKKVVPDDKTYKKVKKEIVKKFRDIKEGTWYFDDVVMATMDYETILTQNANTTSKK